MGAPAPLDGQVLVRSTPAICWVIVTCYGGLSVCSDGHAIAGMVGTEWGKWI